MSKTGWIIFCAFCLVFLVAAIPGFAQEPTTDQPEPKDTPNAKSWMKVDNSESQAVGAEIEEDAVFWGKTVRKIDYNLPKWITKDDIKQFTRNTKIEAGKELARWRVRATMRRIYLLGGIDNIMIRATPVTADEVDVEIKIFPTYLIREIKVQDNKTFNYNEIVSDILHLSVDDDFRESDIPKWKNKLIAALNKEGRLSANVRIGFERTKWRDDNKVDLIINLDENKQYKVSQISLKGDFGQYSRHKILSILNWRTNMKYREEDIVKGLANLKKFLKKNNYLEVTLPEWDLTDNRQVRINHKNREIKLFLELDFGPRVLIEYPGECFTCAQKKWKIPGALGIANQRRFNKWIVKDFEQKIIGYFKIRGYYEATCVGKYEESADEKGPIKTISFDLKKGKKTIIRSIRFIGVSKEEEKKLVSLLTSSKYFYEKDFDKDLENIINYYNKEGYLQAKIVKKNLRVVPGEGLYIGIVMDPGPQAIIKSVDMEGFKLFTGDAQKDFFSKTFSELEVGKPFNPFVLEQAKARLIAEYMNRGYIRVRVKDKVNVSEDGKTAQITFTFREGKIYYFGKIYIHGNKLTKKHVIKRELFITEGDEFSYEDVFASEQALVKLGFFRTVQISPLDRDIEGDKVDLVVELEERNSGYVETGFGYNTYFGYSTAFEAGHKNLAGHGRRLSYHVDVTMPDEKFHFQNRHMTIAFKWPWVARLPMDGKVTIFDHQQDEIGYDLRSFGYTLGLETYLPKLFYAMKSTRKNKGLRKMWDFYTLNLDYEFARDFIYNIDDDVDETQGEIQITTLSPKILRDERDNPFYPTKGVRATMGSINSIQLIWAAPVLLSQVHYLQTIAQTAWFYGIFQIKDWGKVAIAQNVRSGHGQVLRETDDIPISRRFYLGGSTTIRGFGQNEISPYAEDSNTPIGGNFFFQSNSEIRMPLPANLGILLFFDTGNVTQDIQSFYFDQMRATTGMGFRYRTPVGPISADYGLKLNRRAEESFGEFYITIGNAF